MRSIYIISILIGLYGTAKAQKICSSVEYTREIASRSAMVASSIQASENQVNEFVATRRNTFNRDTVSEELINIPVVVHVLYNNSIQNITDAQIKSQLEVINNDFGNLNQDKSNRPSAFKNLAADVRIKFCLAQVDPSNRRTSGIVRKSTTTAMFTADDAMKFDGRGGSTAWNSKKYLNIWVCPMNSRTLGYATAPGSAMELDGVVISYDVFGTLGNLRASFNKGRTTTHEIGHWLGLKHLWGDADCGDDGVFDTPRQKSYNFGCPTFPRVTSCSENQNGDMFMNFMDFTDDGCMNMFTIGQKMRIRALFASNGSKNSFLTAFGCDSNLAQGGPVVDPTPAPVVLNEDFKIFPNPVANQLTIERINAANEKAQTFNIFNAFGNMVYTGSCNAGTTKIQLNHLKPGAYFIRLKSDAFNKTIKFIKL